MMAWAAVRSDLYPMYLQPCGHDGARDTVTVFSVAGVLMPHADDVTECQTCGATWRAGDVWAR